MKKCYSCKEFKSEDKFHRNKIRKDGLEQTCKKCILARTKDYYQRNKEKVIKRTGTWSKANKDKANLACRRWRANHPERAKLAVLHWINEHPEENKAIHKHWVQEHPEKVKEQNGRARARRKGSSDNTLTANEWEAILKFHKNRCAYCGITEKQAKKKYGTGLAQDHIMPVSKGGAYSVQNIVPACKPCNSRKGVKGPPIPIQPLLLVIIDAKAS